MASTTVTLAPLNAVRTAVWARLNTSSLGTGVTLAREAGTAAMPYVAVGPAYKGAGGTETLYGATVVVVQVDAFASSTHGGASKVDAMMAAVATALSDPLTITIDSTETRPFITTVEDDVLNPALQDTLDGPVYAQRYVRFRFTDQPVTTLSATPPDKDMERGQDYVLEIGGTRVGKLTTMDIEISAGAHRNEQLRQPRLGRVDPRHGQRRGVSIGYLYVYDDAGQAALKTAFADKTTPAAIVLTSADDTAGVIEYAGNAVDHEPEHQLRDERGGRGRGRASPSPGPSPRRPSPKARTGNVLILRAPTHRVGRGGCAGLLRRRPPTLSRRTALPLLASSAHEDLPETPHPRRSGRAETPGALRLRRAHGLLRGGGALPRRLAGARPHHARAQRPLPPLLGRVQGRRAEGGRAVHGDVYDVADWMDEITDEEQGEIMALFASAQGASEEPVGKGKKTPTKKAA